MLSAEENILLPLSIGGRKPDKAEFEELLKKVGLADRRKHRPSELSGGQQQRVAIARALVTKPTVVFADEPTGNLDSKTGGEILELLHDAVDSYGQTLVMVTHETRAAAIADRVLFLADGLIVRDLGQVGEDEIIETVQRSRSELIRVSLRGLAGRKLRAALTAIAIVLGVAMVSGTYVLTDSIDQAFSSIFTDVRKGSNAVISGRSAFRLSDDGGTTEPPFAESLLPKVRALPGVAAAEPSVDGEAQLIGDDGKAIVYGGAPNLGFSIASGDSRFNPLTLVDGAWPGPGEVVIDRATVDKEGLEDRADDRRPGRGARRAAPDLGRRQVWIRRDDRGCDPRRVCPAHRSAPVRAARRARRDRRRGRAFGERR